jgi:hypothetical protein
MALGADLWSDDHVLRFVAAAAALELEDVRALHCMSKGVVGSEMALGFESLHADWHITLLLAST